MHITTQIFGQSVHADTLYFAWACMGLVLVIGFILSTGLKTEPAGYTTRQHMAEGLFKFFKSLTDAQIGKKYGDKFIVLIGSIFLFILTSYYAGLLPWKLGGLLSWWPTLPAAPGEHAHAWHGASPCADINVPAAMALIVIAIYVLAGVFVGKHHYVQMFLPINITKKGIKLNLICILELMDLVVRPLTLTLRLFANTFAGETLLATFIALVALVVPMVMVGFEMFVGALQAFIFAVLSTVYIGAAIEHAEHLSHDSH